MTLDLPSQRLAEVALAPDQPRIADLGTSEARKVLRERALSLPPEPAVGCVEDTEVRGVPVRMVWPTTPPTRILCYLHGGGWALGSAVESMVVARRLVAASGALMVMVDYRLAPEDPFPAGLDDAWSVVSGIPELAPRWTGRHDLPLVLMGESAGGNLAAVVARRAALRGGPRIDLQVLAYPVTDCDLDRTSYHEAENQLMLDRRTMAWFWDMYCPDPALRSDPEMSPLRATDLAAAPPAVVITAEHDVLRDEGDAYAAQLQAGGVPVHHVCAAGQMHGFLGLAHLLTSGADALDALARQLGAVEAVLGPPTVESPKGAESAVLTQEERTR